MSMNLSEYLICELPTEKKGVSIILCTEKPFAIGWVTQFKTEDEFASYKANTNNIYAQVDGYRIVVSYRMNLLFKSEQPEPDQLIMEGMAKHFFNQKIASNAGYYKRYKQEG